MNCKILSCILRDGHMESRYFTQDNNIHVDQVFKILCSFF